MHKNRHWCGGACGPITIKKTIQQHNIWLVECTHMYEKADYSREREGRERESIVKYKAVAGLKAVEAA